MSSRSFRRRNNRRIQRQADQGDARQGEIRPNEERREEGAPASGPGEQGPGSPPSARQRQRVSNRRERGRKDGRAQADRQGAEKPREPAAPRFAPECPVCSKPVRELAAALTHRPTGVPAHFECIMKELRDANELSPQEKLCYLGGGTFGILQFKPSGGVNRFTIRKRIPYEEKDTPQEWKKTLLVSG
ncbi:MAG: hypothetical protein NT005_07260 [Spirochaetes bacterium]|nr:hypothetical protein [Spirochaetota bacterium]